MDSQAHVVVGLDAAQSAAWTGKLFELMKLLDRCHVERRDASARHSLFALADLRADTRRQTLGKRHYCGFITDFYARAPKCRHCKGCEAPRLAAELANMGETVMCRAVCVKKGECALLRTAKALAVI